uniref:Uncharacterized protein n=1 Tax=Eiseniibacteriota bacterium TaxID=2212470 RepID=A0A832MLT5_UNCEI
MDAVIRPRRLAWLTLTWIALTGALGPCALFKPADPEAPTGTALVGDYSQYDSTLATMRRAVEAKGALNSRQLYVDALATEADAPGAAFRALFDELTRSRYLSQGGVNVPASWLRPQEETFLDDLIANNQGSEYRMTWERYPAGGEETLGETQVRIFRRYAVFIVQPSTGASQPYLEGWAALRLVRSGTRWVVTEWDDRELPAPSPNTKSFGLVRLESQ